MKICHLVGDSRFGGGSKIITRLAKAGLNAGYDVEVLATDPEFIGYLEEHDVRHVSVDCIWRSILPHRDLLGLIRLCRHLHHSRYDLVHTHTSKAGFVGRLAAKLIGVPAVVHTVHGFSFHEGTRPIPLRILSALERAAAHWCHHLVTVSEFHRDWALSLGIGSPGRVSAIPNGITEPLGITPAARKITRDEFGLADEQQLVLSMGRLVSGKGLEDLVQAMAMLRYEGSTGLRLLLPGTGPGSKSLTRLVEAAKLNDVVMMPGFRSDIGALLSAADFVVLPSHREGLSVALLEAMAAGKPIIASDIGSNLEATEGGMAAVVVPCGDSRSLANAIGQLVSDPGMAAMLGSRARTRWESCYTEGRMIAGYLDLYRTLLRT